MRHLWARIASGDEAVRDALPEQLALLGFQHGHAVAQRLMRLLDAADSPPFRLNVTVTLDRLMSIIPDVADPDAALLDFESYLQRWDDPQEVFSFLAENPRAIELLVKLFHTSRYLTDTLLRTPKALRDLIQHRRLADLKSREEFEEAACRHAGLPFRFIGNQPPNENAGLENEDDIAATIRRDQSNLPPLDALRRFQRSEILRIGACDAFGLIDLRAATVQLSLLADALVRVCLQLASRDLELDADAFAIVALGKLGGEELNYSSDIDLIFLTDGEPSLYIPVAQRIVKSLQDSTPDGFLYRVDVRLRPWGRAGQLVSTIPAYLSYLQTQAAAWEKQALLKARVVAGNQPLGRELLRQVEPLLYSASSEEVRRSVLEAKRRIEADLQRRGRAWGEVKLGMGSIRDVEFVVQALQLVHGSRHRHVRSANTLDGLVRLADAGILPADEYRRLSDGYVFLRAIEHSLQLMHNRQEHALPEARSELTALARRLDFANADLLIGHYESHRQSIRSIFDKYLSDAGNFETFETLPLLPEDVVPRIASGVLPSYSEYFSPEERVCHAALIDEIDDTTLVRLLAEPLSFDPQPTGGKDSTLIQHQGRPVDWRLAGQMDSNRWVVTVVGRDSPGELSIICGLFFAFGFDITEGFVSAGPVTKSDPPRGRKGQTFVDQFVVRSTREMDQHDIWLRFEAELGSLFRLAQQGQIDEAHAQLIHRMGTSFENAASSAGLPGTLDVRIDNDGHDQGTLLFIRGNDTLGFLYELSHALTFGSANIESVLIRTEEDRACDTLLITDAATGGKIVASNRLQELRATVVLVKHFTHLLPSAPNPRAALLHFRSFLRDYFQQPDWISQLASLERPEVLSALAKVLGVSDFLWEDLLRLQHASLFPVLQDIAGLQQRRSLSELTLDLKDRMSTAGYLDLKRVRLNEFKDRELFRCDMRHILGYCGGLDGFAEELTDVAELVVREALHFCQEELQERYGSPQTPAGTECPVAVLALGKFGGRELGFASDLELMWVFATEGFTTGELPISNSTYFIDLVDLFLHSIRSRHEGTFKIDLRLRPYGRAGSLAVTTAAFRAYFQSDGPAWPYERQALIKLRAVAGDATLGKHLEALRDELIYTNQPVDFGSIRAMRERQLRQVANTEFNAKFSPGGLVDLEYLVQALQLAHGHGISELRTANTREALAALKRNGVLKAAEFDELDLSYRFLRKLIDGLRVVRGNAGDLALPERRSAEFQSLARRLDYGSDINRLVLDVQRHRQAILDAIRQRSGSQFS